MALYLLIWGEAANLRHCPECLWFIFHCLLHSQEFCDNTATTALSTATPFDQATARRCINFTRQQQEQQQQQEITNVANAEEEEKRRADDDGHVPSYLSHPQPVEPLTFLHKIVAPIYNFLHVRSQNFSLLDV